MKASEVMNLAKFVKHKNSMLLYFNFSGMDIDDARQVCDYAKGLITRMPKKSVLTLVNVTDVKYDDAFRELSNELAQYNKPYVLAGAVIGVEGWRKLVFWATTKLTGRGNLKLFPATELEAAKDWLACYGVP
jgi:hypothetical protein